MKLRKRGVLQLMKVFSVGVLLCGILANASALDFTIEQIAQGLLATTNNPIDNGMAVYSMNDGNDWEVFLYNGSTTVQLTDNDYNDMGAIIEDGFVVWLGDDGIYPEIFLYDGASTTQITESDAYKFNLSTENGQVVWNMSDGNDYEIYIYDGTQTIQLTDNVVNDSYPVINNGQIAWVEDYEIIRLYDNGCVTGISNAGHYIYSLSLDNGSIAWSSTLPGDDQEIYLYTDGVITQVTDNDTNDFSPVMDNGQVAWLRFSNRPATYELYLYTDGLTTKISDNHESGTTPSFEDGQLVWFEQIERKADIFLYDGTAISMVTDGSGLNVAPSTDSGNILWRGQDTILFASPVVPGDTDIALEYKDGMALNPQPEQIKPGLRLVNNGETDIPLEEITVKYWYTNETAPIAQEFVVDFIVNEYDWTVPGSWPFPYITSSFTTMAPQTGMDTYLEIGFTAEAGTLYGGSAFQVETSVNAGDWGDYDSTDDYSYNAGLTSYTPWDHITVYHNGTLVWGIEP